MPTAYPNFWLAVDEKVNIFIDIYTKITVMVAFV